MSRPKMITSLAASGGGGKVRSGGEDRVRMMDLPYHGAGVVTIKQRTEIVGDIEDGFPHSPIRPGIDVRSTIDLESRDKTSRSSRRRRATDSPATAALPSATVDRWY